MRKILITGGAGFIGTNFIKYVTNYVYDDIFIYNIDSLAFPNQVNKINVEYAKHKNVQFIYSDIRDMSSQINTITSILKDKEFEGIIHFAAESHVDNSIENPNIFAYTNIIGTLNLLELARKYDVRFHHVSTDEVYGALEDDGYFTEESNIQPNSPYSASKASADHLVRAYHKTYGLRTTISRCSNNYGPFQHPEKLIPKCVMNILNNEDIPVYGQGLQIRDWINVYDHCSAIMQIFNYGKYGEVYNIGGNNEITNIELVKMLLDLHKTSKSKIKFVKDRPGHDYRYAIDNSKISKLGWEPKTNFDDGIFDTFDWYAYNYKWLNKMRGKNE